MIRIQLCEQSVRTFSIISIPGFLARAFVALMILVSASITTIAAEQRYALVIGNGGYATAPLANPVNDARLMADTLQRVGFQVTELLDADTSQMRRAILEFGRVLGGPDSVGVFYYAGHGVQVDGQNFLIPLGTDVKDTAEVALAGINLNELLKTMARASSRLNIAILDACRDNPFATNTRSLSRGLAPVRAPTGTFIAYATGPGEVAYDGVGGNSPYTNALAKVVPIAGLSIEQVFRQARREVLKVTNKKQTPWEHSSLTGAFYFNPTVTAQEASDAMAARLPGIGREAIGEIVAWDGIKDTTDPAILERHIKTFPGGVFTELAIVKLERLNNRPKKAWSWILTGAITARTPIGEAEEYYEKAIKAESDGFDAVSLTKAFGFYMLAAERGLPVAMFRLARMYDRGLGVERDLAKAAHWYTKASDNGNVTAMASLGTLYEFGHGVDKNLVRALRLYRLAAEEGDRNAMTSLGYLFAEGKGVSRDERQARRWYGTAAELGQPRAMFNLALMLMNGRGGRVDSKGAVKWLNAASEQKHAGAMRELAFLFNDGRGVNRNPIKAAAMLIAAVEAGNKDAHDDVRLKRRRWSFWTKRHMQRQLAERGLYDGYIHGFFDTRTRRAFDQLAEKANQT